MRPGTGYINGKKVTWAASQTAAAFTPNSAHWVYINSSGVIGISTTRTHVLYDENIILFEVHDDGVGQEVCLENHNVSYDSDVQEFIHETLGTILTPVEGTNIIGADLTRVALGTGGAVGDRQVKIVGTADLNDAGISSNIPDSGGVGVTWLHYYRNGSGQWKEYSTSNQFPMFYNNAGTPTALATSGATDTGLFTCYAGKADPNTGLVVYISVMHTAALSTDAAAQAIIAAGTNEVISGALFQALEPAQLGYVIVTNNGTSGFVSTIQIAKSTARSATSGGGAGTVASGISTNPTNFLGGLSASDSNVQLALDTLDQIERYSTPIASATTTSLSTATGGYVHITGTTTITSFGSHKAGHLHQVVFDGALVLTHHATDLILPGAANITTVAGDSAIFRSEGDGTGTGSTGTRWRCISYMQAGVTGTGANVLATAPNFPANIGIGAAANSAYGVFSNSSLSVATAQIGFLNTNTYGSGATSYGVGFSAQGSTVASAFTMVNNVGFFAQNTTKGAGSTITNQSGFWAADLTVGTNNYGFRNDVSSGANKWGYYGAGTAQNAFAGLTRFGGVTAPVATVDITGSLAATTTASVGTTLTVTGVAAISGTTAANIGLKITPNATLTGAVQYNLYSVPIFASSCTTLGACIVASGTTTAAAFTLTDFVNIYCSESTKGAGSTITNQTGVLIDAFTQGTNVYGIQNKVAAAVNRWGYYGVGTAQNHIAGKLGLGAITVPAAALSIGNNTAGEYIAEMFTHTATVDGAGLKLVKGRGTYASPTAALSGDNIAAVDFWTRGATTYAESAAIDVDCTENHSETARGSKMMFLVTPNATATPAIAMTIENTGNIGIGGTPNANAILDVTSTTKAFMPPRMTTAQKSAIATPTAGMVVYDSTLNKLCVYTTAWETITSA